MPIFLNTAAGAIAAAMIVGTVYAFLNAIALTSVVAVGNAMVGG